MELLERAFEKMGARVKFSEAARRRMNGRCTKPNLALDVRTDAKGEFFLISRDQDAVDALVVLDLQPRDRHLLLMSRDERHWFVAGIPEATPVSRVADAKRALKPEAVVLRDNQLRQKERNRRHNSARIRQGEWFFVRVAGLSPNPWSVLRKEPLIRSRGGKPHMCEQLYRYGGDTVYVSPEIPAG